MERSESEEKCEKQDQTLCIGISCTVDGAVMLLWPEFSFYENLCENMRVYISYKYSLITN